MEPDLFRDDWLGLFGLSRFLRGALGRTKSESWRLRKKRLQAFVFSLIYDNRIPSWRLLRHCFLLGLNTVNHIAYRMSFIQGINKAHARVMIITKQLHLACSRNFNRGTIRLGTRQRIFPALTAIRRAGATLQRTGLTTELNGWFSTSFRASVSLFTSKRLVLRNQEKSTEQPDEP